MIPHFLKPLFSISCCIVVLLAWVSTRTLGGKKLALLGGALEQPVDPPVAGQPMDRDVGLVVQPFALLDVCVGWLRAIKQGKYPVYAGLIVYHLADLF